MTDAERAEKIRWLNRYQSTVRIENMIRDRIEAARTRGESITASLNPALGRGSGANKIETAVEAIEAERQKLAARVDEGAKIRAEIEAAIDALPPGYAHDVLFGRYVLGLHRWQVANRLYISERWEREHHTKGLELLQLPESVPVCAAEK